MFPQLISFPINETGRVEVILQAANFYDSRTGGIIRSVRLGTEAAMATERSLSLTLQAFMTGVLLLHAFYAFVIFILGRGSYHLPYLILLFVSLAVMNATISDEKIIHIVFPLAYKWEFCLASGSIFLAVLAIYKSFNHDYLPFFRQINMVVTLGILSLVVSTLFLDPTQTLSMGPVFYLFVGLACLITLITISKEIYKDFSGNLLMVLAILAAIHHFIWAIYWRDIGISVIHYPFDLIVALGCFSVIWFKYYLDLRQQKQDLTQELQTLTERKSLFLEQTSRNFKKPLYGIVNMSSSVLRRENSISKDSIDELRIIRSVGRQLSLLINDLIDDASLRNAYQDLKKHPFQLQSIVYGVFDLLKVLINIDKVKFVNKVPGDFPTVYGDESRIIQVLYNLLRNAIRYTEEGKIIVEAYIKDGRAYIQVQDTGRGMDQEEINYIFSPDAESHLMNTNESIYELGLSISRQVIELHGGKLQVTSALGAGSVFTFSLPLASEEQIEAYRAKADEDFTVQKEDIKQMNASEHLSKLNEEKITASQEHRERPRGMQQKDYILVVDNDSISLNVIKSILSDERFEVTTVSNGHQALDLLDKKPWSLVITDMMMPKMSGLELTKRIRERFSFMELPILILSARNEVHDIHACFLAGANDYIVKPVEYLELTFRANALIASKNAVQEQLLLKTAWLQAQIQPHFLFNTLNSIVALSRMDTERMHDLLMELSNYLRSKFEYNDIEEPIQLREEVSLVRSYINIESVRFGDRLKVKWDIDEDLDIQIPFLTIQPLVENAIRHGIMRKLEGGLLTIRSQVEDDIVTISVSDTGVGMTEDKIKSIFKRHPSKGTSIGIINTNQRLIQHFGSGLEFESEPGLGTTVSFKVPLKSKDQGN